MKRISIFLITIYQVFISLFLRQLLGIQHTCRFTPSCSEYTKRSIQKYGVLKGLKMGTLRILSCQPFTKSYATTI